MLLIWPENCSIAVALGERGPPAPKLFRTGLTPVRATGGRPWRRFDVMPTKILVVEDNWDFREILTSILRPIGYEVVEAIAAPEGIEKAVAESPSLIIMDLGLPGMDGIEATAALKRNPQTASIPVIAYTVWSDDFKDKAMEAGVAEFLPKTTSPQILRAVIGRLL